MSKKIPWILFILWIALVYFDYYRRLSRVPEFSALFSRAVNILHFLKQ